MDGLSGKLGAPHVHRPADGLRRATKLRASLVKRRTVIVARPGSYLELLGPQWHAAFGTDLGLYTPLRFLAAGYADPHALRQARQDTADPVHLALLPRRLGR